MRIGELSDRSGLPAKTIRYYEDAGLLPPPHRSANGYRDFDEHAAQRLDFIRAAQSVGLRLGEIREILALRDGGTVPCRHVAGLIERHARDIDEHIRALHAMRADLRALARRARHAPERPDGICHIIESIPVRARGRGGPAAGTP